VIQTLASILFFIVFIEIFVVLSVYLVLTVSSYLKQRKEKQLAERRK
jgi:hypothetical protein